MPLLWSFGPKVSFYKSFGPLFIAIAAVGAFFIIWDIIFTAQGFWGFNHKYLTGIYLANLPLGEWLFFIAIPYCCVFTYRSLNYFIKKDYLYPYSNTISNFLLGFTIAVAIVYYNRWYTVITFSLLAALIYMHSKVWKTKWLGRFYLAYLVIVIPFLIVNGILTGTGIAEEVVWYNSDQHIGLRIFTIPFEDAFYGMLLILGITSIYESLGRRWELGYAYETITE